MLTMAKVLGTMLFLLPAAALAAECCGCCPPGCPFC